MEKGLQMTSNLTTDPAINPKLFSPTFRDWGLQGVGETPPCFKGTQTSFQSAMAHLDHLPCSHLCSDFPEVETLKRAIPRFTI